MKRRIAVAVALGLGLGVMPATAALADTGADSKPESSRASEGIPHAFANYDIAPGGPKILAGGNCGVQVNLPHQSSGTANQIHTR
jgi:hypothetical protein